MTQTSNVNARAARPRFLLLAGLLAAALATCAGCATQRPLPPDLPAYQWVDTETALADLRARAAAVKTVSAEATITLTKSDGESVQLEGAVAMQNPGWVRLRAWKFNRAVFDLTLQPAGLWVMTLDDPKREKQVIPASVNAADFIRQWSYFNGEVFDDVGAEDVAVDGDTLVLAPARASKSDRDDLRIEVDRRTLTPRRYVYQGDDYRFELALDRYGEFNGVAWPTRLIATSPAGRVVVEQRGVEINGELAPNAFVPPRRAEKRS